MENQFTKSQIHAYSLIALFWLFFMPIPLAFAQSSSSSNVARRHFQKAESAFESGKTTAALSSVNKALSADPHFTQAWMLLGEIKREQKNIDEALSAYEAAVKSDSSFFPVYPILGGLYMQQNSYEKAQKILELGLRFDALRPERRQSLIALRSLAAFRQNLIANAFEVEIQHQGEAINTQDDEFVSSLLLDGSLMLLTRKTPLKPVGAGMLFEEKFYTSYRSDEEWLQAAPLILDWEPPGNMGSMSISPEGNAIYFAGCGWQAGFGSCDIYRSEYQNGSWGIPRNLAAPVNTSAWETQPSVSVDGRELYFVSNRAGGFGGSDIYRSVLLPDGKWSNPQNLGDLINTSGNEMSPYLHPDGKTLYFASDGHQGMGGFDLFVSRRDEVGRWMKPENLGVPVNSTFDEISLITNAEGNHAYLSSNRSGGFGGFDVYACKLPEEFQPSAVAWVKIFVKNAVTMAPVAASYSLIGLSFPDFYRTGSVEASGRGLLLALPPGNNYALHIQQEGYLFHSEYFDLEIQSKTKPGIIEVLLKPVIEGNRIVLNNVFFAFNSAELSPASDYELTMIYELLSQNSTIQIELSGHTDNTGSESYNQQLSLQRALSVKQWLISKGIDNQRIIAVGYGSAFPVSDNSTEQGRAANRRTELKIIR